MAKGPFVSLHNHTELGSPMDGMNDTYELFKYAKQIDHPAIAITDHGSLAAHYDAWKASQKTGVKLIPGCEFYFTDDLTTKRNAHMVLLPKTELGYKTILRLNFEAFKNQSLGYMGKRTPRISWEHIEQFNQDIFCLTACSNGLLSKILIADNDEEKATCYMKRLQSIFQDRLFLEIQPHALKTEDGKVDQVRLNQTLMRLGHDNKIPYVVTCDAHYLDRDHAKYHDMMLAIKDKKAVDDPDRFKYGVEEMYLKTHEEIVDFFGKEVADTAMQNSLKIAEACQEPTYLSPKGPLLPKFPVKDEPSYSEFSKWKENNQQDLEEDKSYLRYKCIEGFNLKLSNLNQEDKKKYWNRILTELSVLEFRNFSSYMLIVADYINWAKENSISTGPARGSAAGSLVAYLVGITSIDPLKYDLVFERFHNKEKKSFPDIDSDFSDPGRVKDYIRQKYGEDRVASISNLSTTTPKVIIKDVARSLRLGGDKSSAFKISNAITAIMPDTKTIEEAVESSKQFADYMKRYPALYENSLKLQNLTRNWSVHAAGIVISDRPLYEVVPLRIDDKTGQVVTQWEKTRCEENGLIKMDLLGLKTLNVIDDTFRMIKQSTGENLTIDQIPLDDPETFKMISRGETAGVFQLEASLTPLCLKIKPDNVSVISDINALGRPSCNAEQRQSYIRRRFGVEQIKYRHKKLENSLKKTYGISLYEEAMMTLAKDCAGWDLNKSDNLRKITKLKGKDPDLVLKTEAEFIKDCMSYSKMTYQEASDIWEHEILPYGLYGFNRSHSLAYSHISVQTAWLKKHHPAQFMCALINSEDPNSDKVLEYLTECKKMGIKILPPDINNSGGQYRVIQDNNIVTGLTAVKGVGPTAIEEIEKCQPFTNLFDFFVRTNGRTIQKTVIQSLSKAGAFDSFSRTRKDIFDNYAKYRTKANNAAKQEKDISKIELPKEQEEWTRSEILMNEKEVLGRTLSGNLHEVYKNFFRMDSSLVTPLGKISSLPVKTKIKVEVILNSMIKEFTIKKGKNIGKKFAKYAIEDVHGNLGELTVWNDQYEKYRLMFKDGTPIKAICVVDEYLDQKSLSLATLEQIFGK